MQISYGAAGKQEQINLLPNLRILNKIEQQCYTVWLLSMCLPNLPSGESQELSRKTKQNKTKLYDVIGRFDLGSKLPRAVGSLEAFRGYKGKALSGFH